MEIKNILIIGIIGVISLFMINSATATEVDANDYDEIKNAVNDQDNVIVNLENKTYNGHGVIDINNGKNVIIQSKNPNKKSTIDLGGNSQFINNKGNLTLINLIIKNCYNEYGDDTIRNYNGANLTIINCIFINNTVGDAGGAIHNVFANLDVVNSTFINNTANNGGGAIDNYGGTVNITGSSFINNTASYGGAIFNHMGDLNVSYSYFENNKDELNYTIGNTGNAVLDFNWWGSNNNPNFKINGASASNYYTVVFEDGLDNQNGVQSFKVKFVLNGTEDSTGFEKLPMNVLVYINNILIGEFHDSLINVDLFEGENNITLIIGEESFNYAVNYVKPDSEDPIDPYDPIDPEDPINPIYNPIDNNNNMIPTNTNDLTRMGGKKPVWERFNGYNSESATASMKQTGVPIIAILLVLLASIGCIARKK